ncbi:MAG: Asp-tRNA(Asn)/Glu-tRNA(Gln) amidotransferase subunit GatB [Alphaproteobacteria bacterium]|nr:Asp-tRNA(Asn)/Glu-tRNA(Gln) amidotransferase subunit GatB [Alphaproteobacteria bacterium]
MSTTTTGIIKGNTGDWEMVIGLEVHAQVQSKSKLFSGSPTTYGAEPNENVSLVDAAMPGMLPVINEFVIEQAVRTGLGLGAKINHRSVFDRKNYFYPDLPQGYQISQFLDPIVGEGVLVLDMKDGSTREIGITRLHLEQDAGKSLHEHSPKHTFIDLNRSGIALMEIVSEPDIRTPEEAGLYLKKLRTILRYLGTCDGDMDKGNMRCDANISMRRKGEEMGTRCEIKNVNSVRFLMRAIEFEGNRQVEILESGGKIDQETRLFDASTGETRTMRSKEDAQDYRYFPDPDLLPLEFDEAYVQAIRETLPELPDQKKARYMEKAGLSAYDAGVIVAEQESAQYFEALLNHAKDAKLATTWMTGELFGRLNKQNIDIENTPVSAEQLGGLLALIEDNTISGSIAKTVLDKMFETGKDAATIVDEEGLKQVTDTGAIEAQIDEVLAANQDKVVQFRDGKDKLFGFFVGQVMKATQGKANPAMVNELLKKKLAA